MWDIYCLHGGSLLLCKQIEKGNNARTTDDVRRPSAVGKPTMDRVVEGFFDSPRVKIRKKKETIRNFFSSPSFGPDATGVSYVIGHAYNIPQTRVTARFEEKLFIFRRERSRILFYMLLKF